MDIPVIDFTECGLLKTEENNVKEDFYFKAGLELYRAFAEVGFAYVINSGISNEIVEEMNKFSEQFFSLPTEEKLKFHNKTMSGLSYDPEGTTKMHKTRAPEKMEGFRMVAWKDDTWPKIQGMKEKSLHFLELCKNFTHRIMKALGRGMKLKDVDLFRNSHKLLNLKGNSSTLKLNHYHALTGDVEKGSLRFAEHTDFGSLTLLFHAENNVCGLQAELASGKYVDIKQVPNAVLLTVGDQFKLWTGERLRSVKHRVVVPDDEKLRSQVRRTTIYFGVIDDDVLLGELEFKDSEVKNCSKKKPMTAKEYFKKRFDETHPY